MKAIIFGATGMVGQSILRECLSNAVVTSVLSVGRSEVGVKHPKLSELVRNDLFRYDDIGDRITGYDACFFCLGTPSAGKSEVDYTKITYDLTLAVAHAFVSRNPKMTFIYVSGAGADSSESGSVMWARVRGKTENDLFKLSFKAVYVFRPAIIEPMNGIRSRTSSYRIFYQLFKPVLGLLRALFPKYVTTTDVLAKALLGAALHGAPKKIVETKDFKSLSDRLSS